MAANEEPKAQILSCTSLSTGALGTIAELLGVHHSTDQRVLGEAGVERSINPDARYLTINISSVSMPHKCA